MLLSDRQRADAQLVVSKILSKIASKKATRRLQTVSIHHCITHKLRTAFLIFKSLICPRVRMTALDWHRRRLLSTIFGQWVSFVQDEQDTCNKLLLRGATFFENVSVKWFTSQTKARREICYRDAKKNQVGVAYYSYLRLLECFEIIRARKYFHDLILIKTNLADCHSARKSKFRFIVILKLRARARVKDHGTYEIAVAKSSSWRMRKHLFHWKRYTLMRRMHHNIDHVVNHDSHKACQAVGTMSNIWRDIMIRKALIAFKRFTRNKMGTKTNDAISSNRRGDTQFIQSSHQKTSSPSDIENTIVTRKILRTLNVPKRMCSTVSEAETAEASSAASGIALQRWISGMRKRSGCRTALSRGASHWAALGFYRRLMAAVSALQLAQKRSFITCRRSSFAALSHRLRLLRKGLKKVVFFAKATRLGSYLRMTADFKYEMRRLSLGFNSIKKVSDQRSAERHSLVKAVIVWKVTRLVLAVRTWGQWVVRKRKRRGMLLSARGGYQQGIKERACRLWLTVAAGNVQKDKEERMRKLMVRTAKKWIGLVHRNRLLRQRQADMISYSYPPGGVPQGRSSPSSRLSHPVRTDGRGHSTGPDLSKAKPRLLESVYSPHHCTTSPPTLRYLRPPCSDLSAALARSSAVQHTGERGQSSTPIFNKATGSGILPPSPSPFPSPPSHAYLAVPEQHEGGEGASKGPGKVRSDRGLGLAYAAPRRFPSFLEEDSSSKKAPQVLSSVNDRDSDENKNNLFREENSTETEKKKNRELLASEIISFISEIRGATNPF